MAATMAVAVHKKSRDGYELFLHDLLPNNVGTDLTPQLAITFHSIDGRGPLPRRHPTQPAPGVHQGRPVRAYVHSHRQLDAAADNQGSDRLLQDPVASAVK